MEVKSAASLERVLKTKSLTLIRQMFDTIAPKYDFLNHLLSFNIDKYWRKKTISELDYLKGTCSTVLDLATGTGDLAKEIISVIAPSKLIAVDISEAMLDIAKKKLGVLKTKSQILLKIQAAEELKIPDNSVDAVTIAFGVRNFNSLETSLANIYSLLKPHAKVVIIEFSRSRNKLVNFIHKYYLSKLLPFIGRLISGHSFAYNYLVDSVGSFPSGEDFLIKLRQAGFYKTSCKPLTFGICSIYVAHKKPNIAA